MMSKQLFFYLQATIIAMILSQISFYLIAYNTSMMLIGHLLNVYAYWFVYVSLVITTLRKPFSMLTRAVSSYDSIPMPTLIIQKDGIISQANIAAGIFTGFEPEKLVGEASHFLFHNASIAIEQCPICSLLAKEHVLFKREINVKNELWIECSLVSISSKIDDECWIEVIRDISAEKSNAIAEAALLEKEKHFRAIIEQTVIGVYVRKKEKLVYANPRFSEITGWPIEELTGKNITDLIEDINVKREIDFHFNSLQKNEKIFSFKINFRRKDNTKIILQLCGTAITWDGEPAALVLVEDVTELDRSKEQIDEYSNRLKMR